MREPPIQLGILGDLRVPLALGVLRLCTTDRPSEADAIRVLHRGLDRGIRVLDTASSYGLDESDFHYGERLIRRALETWPGPERGEVRVITKAGMARPKGRWVPSGRPESLRRAVDGSLLALGVEQLFLLLLHVKDHRAPFAESLEALAELQRVGKIRHLGLCNVGVPEVRQAQRHFEVRAVQAELSVMDRKASTTGVLALAKQLGIPFLAHSPLGGHADVAKLLKNRAMKPLAQKYGVTPHQAALATLLDLDGPLIPLFGATRIESIDSSIQALSLQLDDEDRALRAKISFEPTAEALELIRPHEVPSDLRPLHPGEVPGTDPEVVVVMGIQGAGKSTRVKAYEDAGYARLNRDLIGGKLEDLIPELDRLLSEGQRRIVLDNTYPSWVSRWRVIRAAHGHRVPVRCVHLATPIDDALVNVVSRMLDRYDRLLGPEELAELARADPNLPPPAAMDNYAASFEEPDESEGFSAIETVAFERRVPIDYFEKGLMLDVDGTVRATLSGALYPAEPNDQKILPNRRETLDRWVSRGYKLFLLSNQSGIASGQVTDEAVKACFDRTVELLGVPVAAVRYCPHSAFPVSCFCRKPMPGLGVELIRKFRLAREHLVMVGDMDSDARFAAMIGAAYYDAKDFFGSGVE
ncbi:MAG: HAD-IIIA family hydrolase [Deltaproteobacteria bacterium]|nr:HAD-IIIA family hydrolase [Deltaproteobacteria bacterium]